MSKVLDKDSKEINTDIELTLKEVLCEELAHREILVFDFCKLIGAPETFLLNVLRYNGLNPELALKFEKVLDISAEFWLKIQYEHELFQLKQLRDEITK